MYKQCALSNVPKAYITMLYVAWCAKYVAIEVALCLQKKVGGHDSIITRTRTRPKWKSGQRQCSLDKTWNVSQSFWSTGTCCFVLAQLRTTCYVCAYTHVNQYSASSFIWWHCKCMHREIVQVSCWLYEDKSTCCHEHIIRRTWSLLHRSPFTTGNCDIGVILYWNKVYGKHYWKLEIHFPQWSQQKLVRFRK